MSDPVKDAWNEVAEGFSKLGQAMKERYRGADQEGASGASEATQSEEGLREAFERLVSAGRDVGQRAADVVRDADVNSQAKQAASSLNEALSATVDMIGREVGGWFGRGDQGSGGQGSDDEPTVVGVQPDVPAAARPSTTGLVTGPVEGEPDVNVADVDPGEGRTE
jgi:hypothetical protein